MRGAGEGVGERIAVRVRVRWAELQLPHDAVVERVVAAAALELAVEQQPLVQREHHVARADAQLLQRAVVVPELQLANGAHEPVHVQLRVRSGPRRGPRAHSRIGF